MEIKLPTNGIVQIKNSSGDVICSVREDGTITGGGTKLYKHEIGFWYDTDSGTGSCGMAPIYVISTRQEPLTLTNDWYLGINNGSIVSLVDDNPIMGISISYNKTSDTITVVDYKCDDYNLETIHDFGDIVTPL